MEAHTSTAVASQLSLEKWWGASHITLHSSHNILTMQHLCLILDRMLSHFCLLYPSSLSQAPGSFPALAHTDKMPFRLRDTQKLRGHISPSHMHTNRKHPRGHGNVGGMQYHRMNFDKYRSGYLQKVGRTLSFEKKPFCATVNLETLGTFIGK